MMDMSGLTILLVEDESLVAMLVEDVLLECGCNVVLAMRLEKALEAAQSGSFDCAILDVNLGETRSYPVADVLMERGIPFIFVTGYGLGGIDPAYRDAPMTQKPYVGPQLCAMIADLTEDRSS